MPLMNITDAINRYILSLPASRQQDLQTLHQRMLSRFPGCRLWYLDGRDEQGKVVSNPNIGYGELHLTYANGTTKPFYRVGISANTTGISVYIMGLSDKQYLKETYGRLIGKAGISGYCIKFRSLKDVEINALLQAMTAGMERPVHPT